MNPRPGWGTPADPLCLPSCTRNGSWRKSPHLSSAHLALTLVWMCVCMPTYIHSHTSKDALITHTLTHTHADAHICSPIPNSYPIYSHTAIHAFISIQSRVHIHSHTQPHTSKHSLNLHSHSCAHTVTHIHMHSHLCTHTLKYTHTITC